VDALFVVRPDRGGIAVEKLLQESPEAFTTGSGVYTKSDPFDIYNAQVWRCTEGFVTTDRKVAVNHLRASIRASVHRSLGAIP
jgi:hypothetical protein